LISDFGICRVSGNPKFTIMSPLRGYFEGGRRNEHDFGFRRADIGFICLIIKNIHNKIEFILPL
jgi:hypothetical protein